MNEILEIKDLYFAYGEKVVLSNVNLKIARGEKLALLGKNGSGKSTLFLILTGILQPNSGKLILEGKEIRFNKKGIRLLRENIGFIFQNAEHQIIAPTVFDEISFGPLNLKLSESEVRERVNRILDDLNLMDLAEQPPHYLSGGELKKVSIADILAMDTEILLFDEPTASLDPVEVDNLIGILEDLHRAGKTIILSTHLVDFAWEWADRVAILADHTIIAHGIPEEVFSNQEALRRANLKEPKIKKITQILIKKDLIPKGVKPKNLSELEALL